MGTGSKEVGDCHQADGCRERQHADLEQVGRAAHVVPHVIDFVQECLLLAGRQQQGSAGPVPRELAEENVVCHSALIMP